MSRLWLITLSGCVGTASPLLSNGTTVEVGPAGEIYLSRDSQVYPAPAPGRVPVLVTAEETWAGPAGIWTFDRTETAAVPLSEARVVSADGSAVRIEYVQGDQQVSAEVEAEGTDRMRIRYRVDAAGDATALRLPYACEPDGTFHGWGGQYHATDQRGEAFDLFVQEQGIGREGEPRFFTGDEHTTYFPMPYWLDARGFGVLFETDYRTLVDLCASDADVATIEVTSTEPLDVVIFQGSTPADVVKALGDYLGRPPTPPDWAWSLWVASQGGAQDVRDDVAALRAADIPFSAIWAQDWTGIRINLSGGFGVEYRWVEDDQLYPELKTLVDELHEDDIRFLAYANPFIDADLPDHFPTMAEEGLLLTNTEGEPYTFFAPNGTSAHPDLTRPETRDYIKSYLARMVEDLGFDGWMVDFSEWTPLDAVVHDGTPAAAYHNRFPEDWQRLTREVMDEARPTGDWASFARAGWTGVQDVTQIHWIGDQEATWSVHDGLPTVVPAMINLGLAGITTVTHDIGGFSGGPSTKELYFRWMELGAFTPVMRTHEGDARDDNWAWNEDEETIAHTRRLSLVHEALRGDLTRAASQAADTSMPLVRHLMLSFPDDPAVWSVSDTYMLGDSLLVSPVVTEGATSKTLYLPEGSWFHIWTGDQFEGPAEVTVEAPLGSPPVFSLGVDRADLREAAATP